MPSTQAPDPLLPQMVASIAGNALNATVDQVESLRPGSWSQVYKLVVEGHDYVIRFSAIADDFERDRFAASFAGPGLPIPRVLALGRHGDLHYAISERIPGGFLDDLDAAGMSRHLPSLLEALDGMRRADTSRTRGFGNWDAKGNAPFDRWQDYLLSVARDDESRRGGGWRRALESSSTGSAAFDEGLEQMTGLLDSLPSNRQVVHGDLLNFNVLVENGAISGIIDWGCGMYGDHLYDVAWFAYWSRWYTKWRELDLAGRMLKYFRGHGADMEHARDRLRCYMIHIGLGDQSYNAFTRNWEHLERAAAYTMAVLHSNQ